jgi:hypothetical protein
MSFPFTTESSVLSHTHCTLIIVIINEGEEKENEKREGYFALNACRIVSWLFSMERQEGKRTRRGHHPI